MGVFQFVVKLLCRSLLFLIRLPCSLLFITGLFVAMNRSGTQGSMGSSQSSNDNDGEYDSTWEGEEGSDHEETTWGSFRARRNMYAAKDMKTFRYNYQCPKHTDDYMEDDTKSPNLMFYRNDIPFQPDGVFIEELHKDWFGDYGRLEYVHTYIQWLFPILEKGMNFESYELTPREIQEFRSDEKVKKRLLTSYKLMLDFYGIKLVDEETGKVERADNWRGRFENLNRNTHNNLRITRILKCLGLLGFQRYQKPLVHFFLEEALVNETLPRVKQSVLDYFMFAVLDKSERKELIKFAFQNFKPKDKFVWCPRKILTKWLKELEKENGTVNENPNAGPSQDKPSDSTSQNYQMKKEGEFVIDINEDTRNEKDVDSKNDENASGECQNPEEQASPLSADKNANTPSEADSQKDGHMDSEAQAAIQEGETNNADNITASDGSPSENPKETSNQSSTRENVENDASLSSGNSGSKQQDDGLQGGESEQGNKVGLDLQHTDRDSKEHNSEEMENTGSESPGDRVTNSAHYDRENSADMNSQKYTASPGEPNITLEQTSDPNSANREKIDTPGSDRNINSGSEDISKEDHQAERGPVSHGAVEGGENIQQPPAPLVKSPESQETMENTDKRSEEEKKQSNEMLNQPRHTSEHNTNEQAKAEKEDPAHASMEDSAKDRPTDQNANRAAVSQDNENSNSPYVKNSGCTESEGGHTHMNEVTSSQVTPAEDKETGESTKENPAEDQKQGIGCARDGDTEKQNIFLT